GGSATAYLQVQADRPAAENFKEVAIAALQKAIAGMQSPGVAAAGAAGAAGAATAGVAGLAQVAEVEERDENEDVILPPMTRAVALNELIGAAPGVAAADVAGAATARGRARHPGLSSRQHRPRPPSNNFHSCPSTGNGGDRQLN